MLKIKNTYQVEAYVGEEPENGYCLMQFKGYSGIVVLKSADEKVEIELDPACLHDMAKDIEEFATMIDFLKKDWIKDRH